MKTVLPSTGKEVRFRPMQGREEKLLLIAKESGDKDEVLTTVCQVVGNCLLDASADAMSMSIFDVEWLFIQVRIASVSPTAPVAYVDGSDKKRYDFEVDLTKVEVRGEPLVRTTVKVTDSIAFEMGWPTAGAFLDPAVVSAETDAETAHQLAVSCVDRVFDGDAIVTDFSRQEADEFLSSLPLEQYQEALDHVARIPTLYYRIGYQNSLGEEREVVLNNLTDFFRFR